VVGEAEAQRLGEALPLSLGVPLRHCETVEVPEGEGEGEAESL
jgi:hypothetical protein